MSRRVALTIGEPLENSHARYFPVAPADSPNAVVCVSERKGGYLFCHTCYAKGPKCAHTEALRDHLATTTADAAGVAV